MARNVSIRKHARHPNPHGPLPIAKSHQSGGQNVSLSPCHEYVNGFVFRAVRYTNASRGSPVMLAGTNSLRHVPSVALCATYDRRMCAAMAAYDRLEMILLSGNPMLPSLTVYEPVAAADSGFSPAAQYPLLASVRYGNLLEQKMLQRIPAASTRRTVLFFPCAPPRRDGRGPPSAGGCRATSGFGRGGRGGGSRG